MNYVLLDHTKRKFSRHYLKDVYVLSNGDQEHCYGCVPNAQIGISVILNGEGYINTGSNWVLQPPVGIYGLIKEIQFHKMSAGYREINLGFEPHFLQLLLKDSLTSLEKRNTTDLNLLLKKHDVDSLYGNLLKAKDNEQVLDIVECFVQKHVLEDKPDPRLSHAYELIKNETWNVTEISKALNVSTVTLRNLFRDKFGLSPKELVKIHRIKCALHTKDHTEESMTGLAYKLGYYDQSHFIHDFKEAIGLTPKQYFENEQLSFDFYNFQRWSLNSFEGINNIFK